MTKDEYYEKAKNAIHQAMQNKDVIFYSSLVLLEIIDVIRKKYPEKVTYRGKNPTIQSQIENKIEEKINKILDIFTKWEFSGRARFMNPTLPVDDFHKKTFSNLRICYGDVINDDLKNEYRYLGPGNDDVQHALIAKECHVNELISRDNGFNKFITLQEFENLKITVI